MELNRRAPSGDLRINQPRRLYGRRVRLVSLRAGMWAGAAAVAMIACLSVEAQAQQAQQYIKADGSKTNDLEAAARADILTTWAAGNDEGIEPDSLASLPLFKQGIEAHWITVTNSKKAGADSKLEGFSSICGETTGCCMSVSFGLDDRNVVVLRMR